MPPTATAEHDDKQQEQPRVTLVAQLRAHLVEGTLDLLPIQHERNVKHEVESLVQSWSESGFLLHGRHLYPWHQVRSIEVVNVEELPTELAQQRLNELLGSDRTRVQDSFWRTRPEPKQDSDGKH